MSRSRSVVVAALVSCASSCASGGVPQALPARPMPTAAPPLEANRPPRGRIVVVALDGVRWQEIFLGSDPDLSGAPRRAPAEIAPNLHRLATERGVAVGAPGQGTISASGPHFVSLPGYNELLSGRPPVWCADNACAPTKTATVLDDVRATGGKVAAFGSWEMLARAVSAEPGSFFVSCGRGGDRGIDPAPGSGEYRPDRITAALALAYWEAERPDAFFLGLGDTDEYAHHGDYAGYLDALARADAVVGRLVELLDRPSDDGRPATLIVTADHGRARDFAGHGGYAPESARVWLIASGDRVHARGAVASPRERHLADVAPTLRLAAGLAPAAASGTGSVLDEIALDD